MSDFKKNIPDCNKAYSLPKNLKALLKTHDMTIAQLSRRSKVNAKTLYQWTYGQKPRDIDQVKRVVEVLGVTIDELAYGANVKSGSADTKYELVLYRISSDQIREKLTAVGRRL